MTARGHILLKVQLGGRWVGVAATADVLKGLLVALAAREWGALPPGRLGAGIPWPRAALYRIVFDSSGPPDARVIPEEVRPAGPFSEPEGP